ncbi:hypothetical protein DUNSADRAFT_4269 [Dunaliella salina]|uniref:Encoded protein n=1 Tax=Dunaliella salina TaxID=3046 RepID=A0ABQ7FUW3_DUNSA|nr:hypothetical protein DUNSADRAFT_4269 [Dunaliella salina]|eukprot:KAF5826188.1 hypothetical protein DUNSADRAFT_4269 [Dunaliella salina]
MVYQASSQLNQYHKKPDTYLTTSAHFFDGTASIESPNPERRFGPHKRSTFATCYQGSPQNRHKYSSDKQESSAKKETLSRGPGKLFPDPMTHGRTSPSPTMTHRGNGTFTVEYPHSSLTYRSLKMIPIAKLGWKSEYNDKFCSKKPYPGYSVLSSRR